MPDRRTPGTLRPDRGSRVAGALACVVACSLVRPAPAAAQLLAGEVVEARLGVPLVGLPIRLLRHSTGGGAPTVVDSSRTFDRGLFQIQTPGPGAYQLEFGVGNTAISVGPIDTVGADALVQRRYQVPLVQRSEERPFFEFQVQEPVKMLPGTRGPVYPEELRSRNVEGQVLAQFVVAASGAVVPTSFKVLRSSDPIFTEAVARAVRMMRFVPARLGGVAVQQLVQQPFDFRLDR